MRRAKGGVKGGEKPVKDNEETQEGEDGRMKTKKEKEKEKKEREKQRKKEEVCLLIYHVIPRSFLAFLEISERLKVFLLGYTSY